MSPTPLLVLLLVLLAQDNTRSLGLLTQEAKERRTDPYGDPLPEGALARMGTTRLRHYQLQAISFFPNGDKIASAGTDGLIRIWKVPDGTSIAILQGHEGTVASLSVSARGNVMASGGQDGTVRMWDLQGLKELQRLKCGEPVLSVSVSDDGKILAAGFEGGTLRLWESSSGKEIRSLKHGAEHIIRALDLSPDGSFIASGSSVLPDHQASIMMWETSTGRLHFSRQLDSKSVRCLRFSPDGKLLGWAAAGVRFLEISTGAVSESQGGNDAFSFGADASTVAYDDKGVRIVRKGETVTCGFSHAAVTTLELSPDDSMLAVVGNMCVIHLFDGKTGKELTKEYPSTWTKRLYFSPNSSLLAAGSRQSTRDSQTRVWDTASGKLRHFIPALVRGFSADAETLLLESGDFGLRTGEVHSDPKLEWELPWRWAFSPDRKYLAKVVRNETVGDDVDASLCEAGTGREVFRVQADNRRLLGLGFTPNARLLMTAGFGATKLAVWDVPSGRALGHIDVGRTVHGFPDDSVFSPDSRMLARGTDGGVGIWELATGRQVVHVPKHGNTLLQSLSFSFDASIVASGFDDGRVELTPVDDPAGTRILRGHLNSVGGLAFSSDGKLLATGSHDTTVLVWSVPADLRLRARAKKEVTAQEVDELWNRLGEADSKGFGAQWQLAASDVTVKSIRARLEPPRIDAARVRQLLADLDHEDPKRRDDATRTLMQLELAAEPAIREALEKGPSPEAKARLESILLPLDRIVGIPCGEALRRHRAVAILESAASVEAEEGLSVLARRSPSLRERREANEALVRSRMRVR